MLDNPIFALAAICIGPLTVAFLLGFGCGVWMARRRRTGGGGSRAPAVSWYPGVPDDEQVAREMDGATLARLHTLRLRWQGRGARQH